MNRKKFIALFLSFLILIVFMLPSHPIAAKNPKWKKIVKADVVGAIEGFFDSGSGWGH